METKLHPRDYLKEVYVRDLNSTKENVKYFFEKTDSLMFWIIGLSIGYIPLIFINIDSLNKLFGLSTIKWVLIIDSLTISFGVLYRVTYLHFMGVIAKIHHILDIEINKPDTYDIENRFNGDETFEELIHGMQNGIGVDLTKEIKVYEQLSTKQQKDDMYKHNKDYYLKVVNWASRWYDQVWRAHSTIAATLFGHKDLESYINSQANENVGKKYNKFKTITNIFYYSTIVSFLITVILSAALIFLY